MQSFLQENKFNYHNCLGDGNCFLYAVRDQIIHHRFSHLRSKSIQELRLYGTTDLNVLLSTNDMKEFVDQYITQENKTIDNYVDEMKTNKTYIEYPFIQCLSNNLNLSINIYSFQTDEKTKIIGINKYIIAPTVTSSDTNIINVFRSTDHYDSLRDK